MMYAASYWLVTPITFILCSRIRLSCSTCTVGILFSAMAFCSASLSLQLLNSPSSLYNPRGGCHSLPTGWLHTSTQIQKEKLNMCIPTWLVFLWVVRAVLAFVSCFCKVSHSAVSWSALRHASVLPLSNVATLSCRLISLCFRLDTWVKADFLLCQRALFLNTIGDVATVLTAHWGCSVLLIIWPHNSIAVVSSLFPLWSISVGESRTWTSGSAFRAITSPTAMTVDKYTNMTVHPWPDTF